jgi:uncharacterized protein (TIGR02145 family)
MRSILEYKLWITFLSLIFSLDLTNAQENWSIQDLNVTTFRNGDSLVKSDSPGTWMATWENYIPAYTCPDGDCSKGILYNWPAIIDQRGLAPLGYRIPKVDDLKTLNKNQFFQSSKGWINNGTGAYFNAFPKGNLSFEGNDYFASGYAAYYWTTSQYSKPLHSVGYVIQDSFPGFTIIEARREDYFSVRCIKNESESNYFDLAESKIKDLNNQISTSKSIEIKNIGSEEKNKDQESKQVLVEKKKKEEEILDEIRTEKAKSNNRKSVKLPFTNRIKNEFNLNSSSLKKVQFYTSGTIILEPVKENKNSTISSGNLYTVVASQNRIIIPVNTPCIVESQNLNGSLNMKFENPSGSTLVFDTRGSLDSRYYLSADWSNYNSNNWVVTYQGQKYRINSAAGNVHLIVKRKRISKKIRRDRVINGMKV